MGCLKCGKKTADEQSFCPACLEGMDDYPVKSDIQIQLPNRADAAALKKNTRKKRAMSAEEQTASLRKRNRWLTALLVVAVALLAVCVLLLIQSWLATGGLRSPIPDCFT